MRAREKKTQYRINVFEANENEQKCKQSIDK